MQVEPKEAETEEDEEHKHCCAVAANTHVELTE